MVIMTMTIRLVGAALDNVAYKFLSLKGFFSFLTIFMYWSFFKKTFLLSNRNVDFLRKYLKTV